MMSSLVAKRILMVSAPSFHISISNATDLRRWGGSGADQRESRNEDYLLDLVPAAGLEPAWPLPAKGF
jgi:hypothetical protein